jgi:hypothetical protein
MSKAYEHYLALFDPFTAKLLSGASSCVLSLLWSLMGSLPMAIQSDSDGAIATGKSDKIPKFNNHSIKHIRT